MKLKEGYAAEYQKRHDEIWPELQLLLTDSGIYDYSIFLDPATHTLFAVQKVAASSTTSSSQDLAQNLVVQRWWKYMADIMETNEDHSPVMTPLQEVFYLP
jgi:L-rhamnose mutarotase